MIPFWVLATTTIVLRLLGVAGIGIFELWTACLRAGLALMFLLTASAHWGRRRPDLIRMVPQNFPRPDLIVTITGVLEILGAIGLLLPSVSSTAAVCLMLLLLAMFPANINAARHNLTIAGQAATPLPLRTLLQVIFLAALGTAGFCRF